MTSPELLAKLRKEEKRLAWEERKEKRDEENKPKWLKEQEKRKAIGGFVLFLFSPMGILFILLFAAILYFSPNEPPVFECDGLVGLADPRC